LIPELLRIPLCFRFARCRDGGAKLSLKLARSISRAITYHFEGGQNVIIRPPKDRFTEQINVDLTLLYG